MTDGSMPQAATSLAPGSAPIDARALSVQLRGRKSGPGTTTPGGDEHLRWETLFYERHRGSWRVAWEQTTAVPNNVGLVIEALKKP